MVKVNEVVLTEGFLEEMWNTELYIIQKDMSLTMKTLYDKFVIDTLYDARFVKKNDVNSSDNRYISASPYNVLNYELVDEHFQSKYMKYFEQLRYIN